MTTQDGPIDQRCLSSHDSSPSRSDVSVRSSAVAAPGEVNGEPTKEVDGNKEEIHSVTNQTAPIDEKCVSRNDPLRTSCFDSDTNVGHRWPASKSISKSQETKTVLNSITATDRPSNNWSLEDLENYALDRASEICNFGRRTIFQTWLFGESLSMIRNLKKEDRGWMNWVKTQPFSLSTASNAIKVFERVSFEELNLFKDMSVTDMKSALDIIKTPIPQKRRQKTAASVASEVANDLSSQDVPQNSEVDSQAATVQDADITPENGQPRKETITDYSRKGLQRNAPEVGPSLTAAEILGQAFNLLIEAESVGITPDCTDVLAQISAKVAAYTGR